LLFRSRCGGKLTSTISSPMQVHHIPKVPALHAREIGEHNEAILKAPQRRRQNRATAT